MEKLIRGLKGFRIAVALSVIVMATVSCGGRSSVRQSWRLQSEFRGDIELWGIEALDGSNIWTVADNLKGNGSIYHFDGDAWSSQFTSGGNLFAVTAIAPDQAWAAGDGIFHFDGQNWRKQYDAAEKVSDISALDPGHVWATGLGGSIYFFDGQGWSKQFDSGEILLTIDAVSTESAYAAGRAGTLWRYDGTTWARYASGGSPLMSVSTLAGGGLWVAGMNNTYFQVGAPLSGETLGGFVARYNGSRWDEKTQTGEPMFSIDTVDDSHVWAAGRHELVFFDGSSWKVQFEYTSGVYHVSASDENDAWLAGGRKIYRYRRTPGTP